MEDIALRLGSIEGKMDMALDLLKEDRKRLSAVEKKQWWTAGAAAVFTGFVMKTQAVASMLGLH